MTAQSQPSPGRYLRQETLSEIGSEGQRKLREGNVLLVGCGGLGGGVAEALVRAGVGRLRFVDRDVCELHNLHRQILFEEEDAGRGRHKATAAADKLKRVNSEVLLEPVVADVSAANVLELLDGIDVVVDGTDNHETRYVLNDACVKHRIPWVYGGAVGTGGMTMTVLPGEGPCLRCIFSDPAPRDSLPNCDTRGIVGTVPLLVAALQATEAIKVLVDRTQVNQKLVTLDVWTGEYRALGVQRSAECRCCGRGLYDFLEPEPK